MTYDPDHIPEPRDWTPSFLFGVFCLVYLIGEIRGDIVNSFGLWWNIEKAITVAIVGWLLMVAIRAGSAFLGFLSDTIREYLKDRFNIRESGDGHGA